MQKKNYKKDINIRFVFAGIAFFSLFLFYPVINAIIYDYEYLEKDKAYNIRVENFFTSNSLGYLNNSIILRDFEDNHGNYIYRIIEKDDFLIKERESDIVRLVKSDTTFFFNLR